MNIVELLKLRGFDTKAKTKLVRHQDKRFDLRELYRTGYIETYQSYQARTVFECEYVVSFLGLEGSKAQFLGVYRVKDRLPYSEHPVPPDFPYPDFGALNSFYYELERLPGFEDYTERIIIDWGNGALSWHQWLSEKEVIEVLPRGYVAAFPGYLDFVLTFEELRTLVQHPEANREWHRMLAAVAGVYLIVDAETGKQYVGSAYGQDGILGRWKQYAKCPHGGNMQLKALLATGSASADNFRYSILRTLPQTLTQNEVIAYEVLYKRKLGSRAFGLNSN